MWWQIRLTIFAFAGKVEVYLVPNARTIRGAHNHPDKEVQMTDQSKFFLDKIFRGELAGPLLHVRFQGKSQAVTCDLLGISQCSSDKAIREALARFIDVPSALLDHTIVDRYDNGNMLLRPNLSATVREKNS
jgi:hypothetical protein